MPQGTLTLTQTFQMVSGTLGSTPIEGRLRGSEITFTAGNGDVHGPRQRQLDAGNGDGRQRLELVRDAALTEIDACVTAGVSAVAQEGIVRPPSPIPSLTLRRAVAAAHQHEHSGATLSGLRAARRYHRGNRPPFDLECQGTRREAGNVGGLDECHRQNGIAFDERPGTPGAGSCDLLSQEPFLSFQIPELIDERDLEPIVEEPSRSPRWPQRLVRRQCLQLVFENLHGIPVTLHRLCRWCIDEVDGRGPDRLGGLAAKGINGLRPLDETRLRPNDKGNAMYDFHD